ncbi:MAG TPA: hypothetical protein VKA96_04165 [Solirubrobacteraceae bacterium]|nr:hypothetical protein [Solirubrobacteraceae bacterium]
MSVALVVVVQPTAPRRMHPPRYIYASTLSRRDRSWGRPRRHPVAAVALPLLITLSALAAVLAAGVLASLPL